MSSETSVPVLNSHIFVKFLCLSIIITVMSPSDFYSISDGVWLCISGCLFSSSICRSDEECVDGMLLVDKNGYR